MALNKGLNGLVPARMRGSGANSGGTTRYRIANAFGSSIFSGDVVKLGSTGTIAVITTTTDHVLGTFQGCEYVDPVSKHEAGQPARRLLTQRLLPSSMTTRHPPTLFRLTPLSPLVMWVLTTPLHLVRAQP